jgi:hypothetical protein
MIQQFHSYPHPQRNVNQFIIKIPTQPCLLQHNSQEPSYGNSQDTPQLMSGLRKCSIYIYICMYENGIIIPIETVPRMQGVGAIKENGGGGEFKYNIFDIL